MADRYISVFSGIGGLEHPLECPVLLCERDQSCQEVLRVKYPDVEIVGDIGSLSNPPAADYVVGGWPCQDLSIAGNRGGIGAKRSGLFFQMLTIAKKAGAHTLIGENVPNLLQINRGRDFAIVLDAFRQAGYPFISWRILNARAFGLPQSRRRLFIVASSNPERALALHAAVPEVSKPRSSDTAYGFYWTGGKRSICFSRGFVPTLKIGASDNNGRAPVAVFLRGAIRKLSAAEFLRLQGFPELVGTNLSKSALLRMAGNAVPAPIGRFVVESVFAPSPSDGIRSGFAIVSDNGFLEDGMTWEISHQVTSVCSNLADFLDDSGERLSAQASAGLLVRAVRAGQPMPRELFSALLESSADREGKLRPSRGNSFKALDEMQDEIDRYAGSLKSINSFLEDTESDEGEDE